MSRTSTTRQAAVRATTPSASVTDEESLGGKLLGADPFGQLGSCDAPGLELEQAPSWQRARESHEAAARASAPQPEPVPAETPEQQQQRRVREIARYGDAPGGIHGAPAYWVRVMLRKRELGDEVSNLSALRKQAETEADDALARLGEALYAQHKDPRLQVLARQLRAVAGSANKIGAVQAAGAKRKANMQGNLAELDTRLKHVEHKAAPVRERRDDTACKLQELRLHSQKLEAQRKRVSVELQALATKAGSDPARLQHLQDQRDELHGRIQTLGLKAQPLRDDLEQLEKQLEKLDAVIGKLRSERAATATALQRTEQHARVESGSARGALRDALLSLARGAMDAGLSSLAPEQAEAATLAADTAAHKRGEEEVHRAAMLSYDHAMYQHGAYAMLGGSAALFLGFLLMIIL